MQKMISLRYPGTCKKCGKQIPSGQSALWHGSKAGVSHYPNCAEEKPEPAPIKVKQDFRSFVLEWAEVKEIYLALISGKKTTKDVFTRANNARVIDGFMRGQWQGGWSGSSAEEMKTYITSGFHVPGIENATPDLVPNRQRRRMKFDEDGELQLDLVYSGFDYPFLEWEKRERKPGMRIEIGISFSSDVNATVISHYQRWIAQLLTTLEESGFDLEVNLTNVTRETWQRNPGTEKTLIRVKRENEASDFSEWSALFAPGGFRHLMFLAKVLAADRSGQDINGSLGYPTGNAWGISLDEETRTMEITNPGRDTAFPEAEMTEKFIGLIQK